MITKLTVAHWKWENGSVKRRCKKENFPFPIQNKQGKWEMRFPTSHFPPTSMNPNAPKMSWYREFSSGEILYKILRIRVPGQSLLIVAVLIFTQLFITGFIFCSTNISWFCISLAIFWNTREILTALQEKCYNIDSEDLQYYDHLIIK